MHISNHLDEASHLQQQILTAREQTLSWLQTLQAPDSPQGVLCISALHDANIWPGMLLPGTYNAVMLQDLLGAFELVPDAYRVELADWLMSHRQPNGIYKIQGMTDEAVYKKPNLSDTWQYIDFHVSNYSMGAVQALRPNEQHPLEFVVPFLDAQYLKAWLSERDLRDPWQEGNNIVNLGSFLLLLSQQNKNLAPAVDESMRILFDWHDRLQEPSTGFWGIGQHHSALQLLHAMAGSMHNFHLWYKLGRQLPYQNKAVDYALTCPPVIHSACIDVDLIDLLVHAYWQQDYRRHDIEVWLLKILTQLLNFQNKDGGFSDVMANPNTPPRKQDGWVKGYEEPQGHSNTFATWFRWIAIAMVAQCLWPHWKPFTGAWKFRSMVGIGFAASPNL